MELFYSDHFPLPLPERHRFPMSKYRLLRERIVNDSQLATCKLLEPSAATDNELLLVHTGEYLEKIKSGRLTDVELRRLGFPWSELMVERSRRSTGASIEAARSALSNRIAGNLAGGTHHAFPDSGQGYCVFNDVCVAVAVLQKQSLISKALIIDCDVHQGNGTAFIARNNESIFTISLHGDKNYPFKKTASDIDVALPEGVSDDLYLENLVAALDQADAVFQPDFVFYLAGADPFIGDRLGLLNISKTGLKNRDLLVFDFFCAKNIPIAFCMAGGYAPDTADIVDIHVNTVTAALDVLRNSFAPPTSFPHRNKPANR